MRYLKDFFILIIFTRKAAKAGLFHFLASYVHKNSLYIISFLFAPMITLLLSIRAKKEIDLAKSLKKLGPIFIKFGQALSTRGDLVGDEIALSLSSLQDKLEPFPVDVTKQIIESQLHSKIEGIFAHFEEKPVAAASIAQVHKAKLLSGELVAVKVLRPNILETYKKDIRLLYSLARLASRFVGKARMLRLLDAVKIFEQTMNFELDLKNEAAACSELRDNLMKDKDVLVPKIYWDYCSQKVAVLEWMDGVSIYDDKSIEKWGLNKQEIAKKLAITFLNQAFRDGYFHADLHPGNILVRKDGKIVFLDFGIMGRLSDKDRFSMAEILYSFLQRDYRRVAEVHIEAGIVPRTTNVMDFALACRAAAEPIIGRPLSRLSIGYLLESLFKITDEFGMQTQPQLIMLQKTILVVEGVGKALEPGVNMWNLAEPWIKRWAAKNITLDARIYRFIKIVAKEIINSSWDLPKDAK